MRQQLDRADAVLEETQVSELAEPNIKEVYHQLLLFVAGN
jgi:hypothetical protein